MVRNEQPLPPYLHVQTLACPRSSHVVPTGGSLFGGKAMHVFLWHCVLNSVYKIRNKTASLHLTLLWLCWELWILLVAENPMIKLCCFFLPFSSKWNQMTVNCVWCNSCVHLHKCVCERERLCLCAHIHLTLNLNCRQLWWFEFHADLCSLISCWVYYTACASVNEFYYCCLCLSEARKSKQW